MHRFDSITGHARTALVGTVACALVMACVGWPAIPARAQQQARATGFVTMDVIGGAQVARVSFTQGDGVMVDGGNVDYRIIDTTAGIDRTVWVMY